MKLTKIFIFAFCAIAMCACHKEEKVIVTNSRGVPMSVAKYIMGDSYEIDTLYKGPERSVIFIDNPDCTQHIIYSGEELLVNSPTLRIDSLGHGVYDVQDMLRSTKVSFANPRSIDRLRATFPVYEGYPTVVVCDTSHVGQRAIFAFAMSRPQAQPILNWVEASIDDSIAFNTNIKAFAQQMEHTFFDQWDQEESQWQYVNSRSMLVYEVGEEYVTYNDFFYGFMGGAHGMTCNRYISYLTSIDKPVTAELLFVPDSEDALRELIYEAIAEDEDFMSQHKITSLSQARTYVQRYLDGEPLPIPDPGLLHEGVIFSYQPYEIGPYSDGLFQLIIPYHKIAPYIAIDLHGVM